MVKVYDITAPLCFDDNNNVSIPKPKSAEIIVKTIGHDLVLSGMKIFRYLSNTVCFDFHMGTHFDIPSMFAYDTFNPLRISFDFLIREAVIVNLEHEANRVGDKPIRVDDVRERIDEELFIGNPRSRRPALILRTGYSKYWCNDNTKYLRFPGFSKELIDYIAYKLEPPFIGIDAISVDRTVEYRSLSLYPDVDTDFINLLKEQEYTPFLNHDTLLRKNILILENLYLNDVPRNITRGLIIPVPLFRYKASSSTKLLIAAIPCRVLFISPPPAVKEIIEQLGVLEKILTTITRV